MDPAAPSLKSLWFPRGFTERIRVLIEHALLESIHPQNIDGGAVIVSSTGLILMDCGPEGQIFILETGTSYSNLMESLNQPDSLCGI